jgi:hypothetical protein
MQRQIDRLIRDLEKAAKQLRSDIRQRAQAAPKQLQRLADRLRQGGADLARQVEDYARELRVSLEKGAKPAKSTPKRKRVARRRGRG